VITSMEMEKGVHKSFDYIVYYCRGEGGGRGMFMF